MERLCGARRSTGERILAMDRTNESHAPGSQPAHFNQLRGDGGDRDNPGQQPDELPPGKGDDYEPDRSPDEAPDQGDFGVPDSSPVETPPQPDQAPAETPPPD
jgi:hypothetical protein